MFGCQQETANEKVYSFTERTEWMLEARSLLDVNYYPRIAYRGHWVYVGGNSRGSAHIQRDAHIDTIVQITDQGETLTIDEKIDSQNRYTLFLETVSMKEFGKPGWMQPGVSKADILLWAFQRKRPCGFMVYTFWLEPLIEWFWPRVSSFQEYPIQNREGRKRWTTLGRSVSISEIPSYCCFQEPEIVKSQLNLF